MDIHHALTRREMIVGKTYVDGYYEKDGERIALEFNGCTHHGYACCYDSNNTHPLSKIPYAILRNRFDDKVETLTKMYGLKVEVMWEDTNNPAAVGVLPPKRLSRGINRFGCVYLPINATAAKHISVRTKTISLKVNNYV